MSLGQALAERTRIRKAGTEDLHHRDGEFQKRQQSRYSENRKLAMQIHLYEHDGQETTHALRWCAPVV